MAIAIPIFTTQLEKSREATDIANIRSAYAEAMAEAIADGGAGPYTAQTPNAQSTGAFDQADTDGVEWATLPASVTTGSPFTVSITIEDDGTPSVSITQ